MLSGWEKEGACWTNISSPGFVQRQGYRGYSETRRRGSFGLSGRKKNSLRLLRCSASELLRQEDTAGTGFILWGCPNLFGGGSSEGLLPELRESEAGRDGLACGQSFLHEAICVLCGAEVPLDDSQGCCKGTKA